MSAQVTARRHIKVRITRELIAALLDVPDDVRVHRIAPTGDPGSIEVYLESERFDDVPPEAETPMHYGGLRLERATFDDDPREFWRMAVEV